MSDVKDVTRVAEARIRVRARQAFQELLNERELELLGCLDKLCGIVVSSLGAR